jgi:hypothetical protein
MVRDNEEGTSRRHVLAPLDGEPARCVLDNPCRAVAYVIFAQRAVVADESAGDVMRDRPDESAHDLDAQARRLADKRLGALARNDLSDLTALGY